MVIMVIKVKPLRENLFLIHFFRISPSSQSR